MIECGDDIDFPLRRPAYSRPPTRQATRPEQPPNRRASTYAGFSTLRAVAHCANPGLPASRSIKPQSACGVAILSPPAPGARFALPFTDRDVPLGGRGIDQRLRVAGCH
jgi:hypothetical protein